MSSEPESSAAPVHKRRVRYSGKNPRRFDQKYKELNAEQYPDEVAKVLAAGKTPAGQHVPIMVNEVLECLQTQAGDHVVDCTLGYGGHSRVLWQACQPAGHLLSLDVDPIELARTEMRLRMTGMNADSFTTKRCNFAGLHKALAEQGWHEGVDVIFADLGLSSMQIDNPARGFTFKADGPLDMRMNPERGVSATQWLADISVIKLTSLLQENADEPQAALLADALINRVTLSPLSTTRALAEAVKQALPVRTSTDDVDATVRRVFQAIRIAVNEEFSALDSLMRAIPAALKSGGRVAILTFHSGEDRRVKKAFQEGLRSGVFSAVSDEVIRASMEEQRANPRSSSAKLRWAVKT
jgi:16S rRNA (cytosine1402-N4)-methyltransferase